MIELEYGGISFATVYARMLKEILVHELLHLPCDLAATPMYLAIVPGLVGVMVSLAAGRVAPSTIRLPAVARTPAQIEVTKRKNLLASRTTLHLLPQYWVSTLGGSVNRQF
jgi:hypothetical protein